MPPGARFTQQGTRNHGITLEGSLNIRAGHNCSQTGLVSKLTGGDTSHVCVTTAPPPNATPPLKPEGQGHFDFWGDAEGLRLATFATLQFTSCDKNVETSPEI